jgi:hypothetical protein
VTRARKGPVAEDSPALVFVPLDELATPPPGIIEHLVNYWWLTHPMKGAVFYKFGHPTRKHPQANMNKSIMLKIRDDLYPWAEVVMVVHAFRTVDLGDYS